MRNFLIVATLFLIHGTYSFVTNNRIKSATGTTWSMKLTNTPRFPMAQVLTGALLSLSFNGPILSSNVNHPFESYKVSADVQSTSVFSGKYSDPFHPGCLRSIEEKQNEIVITGSDDVKSSKLWVIKAKKISPTEILVDFSPKGGPPDLLGKYNTKTNAIQWPDGNAWTKSSF